MSRYAVNTAEVASKVIDGEAIAIHLTTGTYYSLDGSAGRIWACLEQRLEPDIIVRLLQHEYVIEPAVSQSALEALLKGLLEERLVVEATEAPGMVELRNGERRAWEPPVFNVYRDMADLLALDPPVPGLELADRDGEAGRPPTR